MASWILYAAVGVLLLIGLVAIAFHAGYFLRDLRDMVHRLKERLDERDRDDVPTSAVIEAKKPREIWQDKFTDDDSAIVTAKKPTEVAREKDRKLNEELDRLGR